MESWKKMIKEKAEYALRSHSRDLLHEAYGMAKWARLMGGIDKYEFDELNQLIVVLGMNNPQKCKEIYGDYPR